MPRPSWHSADASEVSVVPRGDPHYPPPLENIPDPPSLLYVKGELAPRDQLAIAVVGSRHCTPYGARIAERLSAALARTGFTIVSGLARGIDAAAHRGAIKAGGRTIGVLANGLAIGLPSRARRAGPRGRRGRSLGQRDAHAARPDGRLIHPAQSDHLGAVAGRAGRRGDPAQRVALDRRSHAMEQNREVFAVPGPADSIASRGCHRLIRDGARLVETVDDILEELGPLVQEVRTDPEEPPVRHPAELALSDSERSLLGRLDDHPTAVDDLIARTGMTAGQVMATLSVLELKRLVKRLPGHRFVRV